MVNFNNKEERRWKGGTEPPVLGDRLESIQRLHPWSISLSCEKPFLVHSEEKMVPNLQTDDGLLAHSRLCRLLRSEDIPWHCGHFCHSVYLLHQYSLIPARAEVTKTRAITSWELVCEPPQRQTGLRRQTSHKAPPELCRNRFLPTLPSLSILPPLASVTPNPLRNLAFLYFLFNWP